MLGRACLGATAGAYPVVCPRARRGEECPATGLLLRCRRRCGWRTSAWSDGPDPDEDAYAAGVAWGSAAAPPPTAAVPPDEEEDNDDDFDWSDHGEEGGGPQMQEAIEASLQSVGDDRVQRARTSCQLKAKEASELAWALKDSSSMDLALRRKRARENQKRAANGVAPPAVPPKPPIQHVRLCSNVTVSDV